MALSAGAAVAGTAQSVLHGIPILGMRVYLQPAQGAVTLHADIALRVAGLAGRQVLAGLASMTPAPLMGRQD